MITTKEQLLAEIFQQYTRSFNDSKDLSEILNYLANAGIDLDQLEMLQSDSNIIAFDDIRGTLHGTSAIPLTGNLTINTTNAKRGAVAIVLHQDATAPDNLGEGTIISETGTYTTGELNIIIYQHLQDGEFIKALPTNPTAGATTFAALTDTPASYAGQAAKKVVVNALETALEFVPDTAPASTFNALTDTPATKTAKALVAANDAAAALIYSNVFFDITTGELRIGSAAATGGRSVTRGYGTTSATLAEVLQNSAGLAWYKAFDSQQVLITGNGVSDTAQHILRINDSDNTLIFGVQKGNGGIKKAVATLLETDAIQGNQTSYKLNIYSNNLGTSVANDYAIGIRAASSYLENGSRWLEINTRVGGGALAANRSAELVRFTPDAYALTTAYTSTIKGLSCKFTQGNSIATLTNGIVDYTSLSLTPLFKATGGTKFKYKGIDLAFDAAEFIAASFTNLLTDCIGININPLTAALTATNWTAINSVKGLWVAVMPTYADNAAAVTGGLAVNTFYKTATGDLRIVV